MIESNAFQLLTGHIGKASSPMNRSYGQMNREQAIKLMNDRVDLAEFRDDCICCTRSPYYGHHRLGLSGGKALRIYLLESSLRGAAETFLRLRERLIKTDLRILDDLGIKPMT